MQDVLRRFYPEYLDVFVPNDRQVKAVHHIMNCKTGAYGANISQCSECGHIQYHNNSCRDRSCPMCQTISNELWVDAQNEHVLDIDYYHPDLLQSERTVFPVFPKCIRYGNGTFQRYGTHGRYSRLYQHHAHVGV